MGLRVIDIVFESAEAEVVWDAVDLGVGFEGCGGGSLGRMKAGCAG
jgi:hypothetical protein